MSEMTEAMQTQLRDWQNFSSFWWWWVTHERQRQSSRRTLAIRRYLNTYLTRKFARNNVVGVVITGCSFVLCTALIEYLDWYTPTALVVNTIMCFVLRWDLMVRFKVVEIDASGAV